VKPGFSIIAVPSPQLENFAKEFAHWPPEPSPRKHKIEDEDAAHGRENNRPLSFGRFRGTTGEFVCP
jgi:hypothetical protein